MIQQNQVPIIRIGSRIEAFKQKKGSRTKILRDYSIACYLWIMMNQMSLRKSNVVIFRYRESFKYIVNEIINILTNFGGPGIITILENNKLVNDKDGQGKDIEVLQTKLELITSIQYEEW